MTPLLLVATVVLGSVSTGPARPSAQPASDATSAEVAAIRSVVEHWRQTWDGFDASPLKNDYADDADWLNAFGIRLHGRAEILKFMADVVQRPTVKARHTVWEEPRIRLVRADVALATRDYRTVGHKTPDGKEMPERHTHSTWLLIKNASHWQIVNQVISDDNGGA